MTKVFVTITVPEVFKSEGVLKALDALKVTFGGTRFTSKPGKKWVFRGIPWPINVEEITGLLTRENEKGGTLHGSIIDNVFVRNHLDGSNSINGILDTKTWTFKFWDHFNWNDATKSIRARNCDEIAFVSDEGLPSQTRADNYTTRLLLGDDSVRDANAFKDRATFMTRVVKPKRQECWKNKEYWHSFYNKFRRDTEKKYVLP